MFVFVRCSVLKDTKSAREIILLHGDAVAEPEVCLEAAAVKCEEARARVDGIQDEHEDLLCELRMLFFRVIFWHLGSPNLYSTMIEARGVARRRLSSTSGSQQCTLPLATAHSETAARPIVGAFGVGV